MSGVNYYVHLSDEPSDDDLPRMTATRAMVAALTGVDTERQGQGLSSGATLGGYAPRWWNCRVEGPQVKQQWIKVAEFMIRAGFIDKYTRYGEMEQEPARTSMKRFLLQGVERQFECTLYSNGCVHINLDPCHYRIHFCSLEEFRSVHDEPITWLDEAK